MQGVVSADIPMVAVDFTLHQVYVMFRVLETEQENVELITLMLCMIWDVLVLMLRFLVAEVRLLEFMPKGTSQILSIQRCFV